MVGGFVKIVYILQETCHHTIADIGIPLHFQIFRMFGNSPGVYLG